MSEPSIVSSALSSVVASSVVSEPSIVSSALSSVVAVSVVSKPSIVSSALSSVIASSVAAFFSRLFGANGNGYANQRIHVQRTVDVSDMCKWVAGASYDAVDLSDVGTVIRTDHNCIKRRR